MSNTSLEITPEKQAKALEQIAELRKNYIDVYDEETIRLLALRSACVEQIGKIKRDANLTVHDPSREAGQFARYEVLAKFWNVSPEQIIAPFRTIVLWSKFAQKNGFRSLEDLRRRRFPRQKT